MHLIDPRTAANGGDFRLARGDGAFDQRQQIGDFHLLALEGDAPKVRLRTVARHHHHAVLVDPHHRIGILLVHLNEFQRLLLAQAAPELLAADVGDVLDDFQVVSGVEVGFAVLAVDDPNHLAIAHNGNGHFRQTLFVVEHVPGVFAHVGDDFSLATQSHCADNALRESEGHGLVDLAVVDVFGPIGGLLDPLVVLLVKHIDHTILEIQAGDALCSNVPQDVFSAVASEDAPREIFDDLQLRLHVAQLEFAMALLFSLRHHNGEQSTGQHKCNPQRPPPRRAVAWSLGHVGE